MVRLILRNIVSYWEPIDVDASFPDGIIGKLLDVSLLNGLSWEAKISPRPGIELAYDWYCRQKETIGN